MLFSPEEWRSFLNKNTLTRKAGVTEHALIPLAVKELTDNALDVTEDIGADITTVDVGLIPSGFYVQDGGPGMDRDTVIRAFSVNRSLVSSKLLRLPTRGALGNGLRVVGGVAAAFGADLSVHSNGRAYTLSISPETGEAEILEESPSNHPQGMRVEMTFSPEDVPGEEALAWGRDALLLARGGGGYSGKSSPYWYAPADLRELLLSAEGTIREVAVLFEGNAQVRIGDLGRVTTPSLEDAETLLNILRGNAKAFNPQRLKGVGQIPGISEAYASGVGEYEISDGAAIIPFRVDVWAAVSERASVSLYINRTPAMALAPLSSWKANIQSFYFFPGSFSVSAGRKPLSVRMNITTPYVPFLSDGKAPDLTEIVGSGVMEATTQKAVNIAKRKARESSPERGAAPSQKQAMMKAFPEAARTTGGDGKYEFSQRQLFYVVRPFVADATGEDLQYEHFTRVLTEYENENGDIPGLYRDNRGTLYVPHLNKEIPIGTRSVAQFTRPAWTFHKILYCEKEGFFPTLRSARWPEKWDCALLTSKGYASRAVKDLLDMLEDDGEPIMCFCIHDADADGTRIFQSLVEETASRGKRKVKIINLGLDPEEAVIMGLPSEKVDRSKGKSPADYLSPEEKEWLRCNRIELNAMTTPQFLSWLDGKMEQHEPKKLIPPSEVIGEAFNGYLHQEIAKATTVKILREAKAGERIMETFNGAKERVAGENWEPEIIEALEENPVSWWRSPIAAIAGRIAKGNEKEDQ